MRILPRLNEDVNEEWINDKSRFACDGLRTQRLTTPLVRRDDKFYPTSWEGVLAEIANTFERLQPKGHEVKAIAGHLVETESLVAMKDLVNKLGSENLALDQPLGGKPPAHGVDSRSNYLFNSRISGVEESDAILLVGTNPRHEAALLNVRIRKRWLRSDVKIALVGGKFPGTFEYTHLGQDFHSLKLALAGGFGQTLLSANRPTIIVGSAVAEHPDGKAIFGVIGQFVDKNAAKFISPEWNGYNILQRAASRTGAYDVGFCAPNPTVAETMPKVVFLLGADEIQPSDIPKEAFIIYQGHHGDTGAQYADIVLPGATYIEKSGTYVNTEGRAQLTRPACVLPGVAREDWKIIRAVSEVIGATLPYDNITELRARMEEISPALTRYDVLEQPSVEVMKAGVKTQLVYGESMKARNSLLQNPIENFYFTDTISRSSKTMARCSAANMARTNVVGGGDAPEQVAVGGGFV